ncbi:MAG: hypothetical protein DI536_12105 [Archangium gephyra]|uniref:Lipoprotein n=1 Tax=Archangium gephyra TaxID=48 RepID=A0A2W5TL33_9BACT|nr:MAG: hypothetical protein DI536_12105 [Archangium gephyra]
MLRSLPLVALLFVTGCKKDKDGEFWKWVGAHVTELKLVKTGDEPVVDELSAELGKAAPGLVFELGVGTDPFEFIISADGMKDRFDDVKRLTGAAPAIAGLKVIAFRPRKEIDGFEMHLGDLKLAADEVKYLGSAEKDGKLSLDLYIDGYSATTEDAVKRAGFVLLDSAIGEFDMETRIGGIEFHGAPAPAGAKPLPALPAELDALKK